MKDLSVIFISVIFLGFIFSIFIPIGTEFNALWFLFGLYFKIDFISKQFLIITSFVWLISSIYAFFTINQNRNSFFIWFFLTFIGNFMVCISYDAIGFYMFFSLMTLSAFGLILHNKTQDSQKAAIIYIKYAIFGEVLIFIGVVGSINIYGGFSFEYFRSTNINSVVLWAILIGFGIKVGMFLLHSWLAHAHSAAPASASAVLSGVMLKVGILGWLRFLPDIYNEIASNILLILGIFGIFGGLYGFFQDKIKVILAYSSISQMGYLVVLFGLFLGSNAIEKNIIIYAILFFITHHAINKSALFILSGDIQKNGLSFHNSLLVVFFAVSLVGLPMTSGMMAKTLILDTMESKVLIFFLTTGSFITSMLMVRFYLLSMKFNMNHFITKSKSFIVYPLLMLSVMLSFIVVDSFKFDLYSLVLFSLALFFSYVFREKVIKNF